MKSIADISRAAPSPTWLFALAAACGAVALAAIFGVEYFAAAALIFLSAGAGALLRRALGRLSGNLFLREGTNVKQVDLAADEATRSLEIAGSKSFLVDVHILKR